MKIDGSPDDEPLIKVQYPTSLDKLLKPSRTSSRDIEQKAENIEEDILDKVSSQQKINNFIDQYVVTEEFMNKVRRYARQEFDSMLLKVFIWVTSIILGTVIANLLLRKP